ncbi:MAG: tetratricopeptide repeat protein [Planctomycetes bacterium]|nr:tetratricopeptide repeat protein [Planctomycetota bacterium]
MTIQNLQRATQARAAAARFLAEGKFDLASARYEEALQAAPADAGLLAEVGSALFRANRLGDARKRFESSLQLDSRNTAAMEGMALVAAGEQRFTDARDQLRKLLDVDPKAGRIWLRYGDLEYRLGNRIEAFDAWDRVLAVSPMEPQIQASARDRLTTLRR